MSDQPEPPRPAALAPGRPKRARWFLLGLVVAALLALHFLRLDQRLWPVVKEHLDGWKQAVQGHFALSLIVFFAVYVLVIGLSIPASVLFGLTAGFLFERWWGTVVINLASTTGAAVAFLASRYLFRDAVRERFGPRLAALDEGVARDGSFYILTLRLLPVVPFFVTNLGMGLTRVRFRTFWWASQVGMLPGNFVFVNAGTELGHVDSPAGLVSPSLLVSLGLLAVLPLLGRLGLRALRARGTPAGP